MSNCPHTKIVLDLKPNETALALFYRRVEGMCADCGEKGPVSRGDENPNNLPLYDLSGHDDNVLIRKLDEGQGS